MSSGSQIGENARLLARNVAHTVFRVTQASSPGAPGSEAATSTAAPRRVICHGFPVAANECQDEAPTSSERAVEISSADDSAFVALTGGTLRKELKWVGMPVRVRRESPVRAWRATGLRF